MTVTCTEKFQELGKKMQDRGHEYGVTTGRLRRCGWLDGPMLRYSNMINGYSAWVRHYQSHCLVLGRVCACVYLLTGVFGWEQVGFLLIIRIAVTKLDILDDFEELKIGVAYQREGKKLTKFPGKNRPMLAFVSRSHVELDPGTKVHTSSTKNTILFFVPSSQQRGAWQGGRGICNAARVAVRYHLREALWRSANERPAIHQENWRGSGSPRCVPVCVAVCVSCLTSWRWVWATRCVDQDPSRCPFFFRIFEWPSNLHFGDDWCFAVKWVGVGQARESIIELF